MLREWRSILPLFCATRFDHDGPLLVSLIYNSFCLSLPRFSPLADGSMLWPSIRIDTPGVIERVSMLFHDNPYLIQGFNTFLPPGYRIEISNDPRNMDTITVTTPMGVMTQNISAYGAPVRMARESLLPTSTPMIPLPQQPPFPLGPPPVLPVGIGNGSRPATPSRLLSHPPDFGFSPSVMYSSPATALQAKAAAAFLGNMGNRQDVIPPGEFNHAIQFLNKIKVRFEDDSETYKQFLEILHAYQKEQKHLHDVRPLTCSPLFAGLTTLSVPSLCSSADALQGGTRSHARIP